jgi:hypothetical protein
MDEGSKSGPNAIRVGLNVDRSKLEATVLVGSHRESNHGVNANRALSGSVNASTPTEDSVVFRMPDNTRSYTRSYPKTVDAQSRLRQRMAHEYDPTP